MVSRNFLDHINSLNPPSAVEAFDPSVIFSEDFADLRVSLPDWSAESDSLLYRALKRISLRYYLVLERGNNSNRRTYVYYAEDSDLEHAVALVGIIKQTGETDDELKDRLPRTLRGKAVGTIDGIVTTAFEFADYIVDAQADEQADLQTVHLWTLKRIAIGHQPITLTAAEKTALQVHSNSDPNKYIGANIIVQEPTLTPFTVVAEVHYYAGTDAATLALSVRNRVYDFIQNRRLGLPVNQSALYTALTLPGVDDVDITTPGNSLAAVPGTKYTCALNDTDVVLTFTEV